MCYGERPMAMKQPSINAPSEEWLVYADQLQSQGDPRGELIALNHAIAGGNSPEARDKFVKTNAERLLGPAGGKIDALRLSWRWIWIDKAEVIAKKDGDAIAAAALLDSPLAAEMTELTLTGDPSSASDTIDLTSAVSAVANKGLPASCRSLSLIDARAARSSTVIATFYDPPNNLVELGELGALWSKLGKVERLHLSVNDMMQVQWGSIEAPALKSLRVDCLTSGGRDEIPEAFDEANWPNLE